MEEVWKDMFGYECLYQVSNYGNIFNINLKKLMAHKICDYPQVGLSKYGLRKFYCVHFLVARAFIGERPEGLVVNHKDGDKYNCYVGNLEYITKSENTKHAANILGKKCKLSKMDVFKILDLLSEGKLSQIQIADKFGVKSNTISNINTGKSWECITGIEYSKKTNDIFEQNKRLTNPKMPLPECGEIWKDIVGYEGLYQASNLGRIWSFYSNKLIKHQIRRSGYYSVQISKDNIYKAFFVHVLVARAFIGERPDNYIVNHKDGFKDNNNIDNLEYITKSANARHSYDVLNHKAVIGSFNGKSKLNEDQVAQIKRLLQDGFTQRSISKIFNIGERTICSIKLGETWTHIVLKEAI